MSYSIIGGADGPTSVFIAGKIGNTFAPDWLNLFGIVVILIILIPNIIYMKTEKDQVNTYQNKLVYSLEQIGRYASMFFMIFNIGIFEYGPDSLTKIIAYVIINLALVISYLILWLPYIKRKSLWNAMALAIIPTCIFLISGILLEKYLLFISAILFGICHITITYKNHSTLKPSK